jgi:hypothetical protein
MEQRVPRYHSIDKKTVARNLREFGEKNFHSMKEFAFALGTTPGSLYSGYLNSRRIPGPAMLLNLVRLGCDIHWLLTGETIDNIIREEKTHRAAVGAEYLSFPGR